MQWHVKRAASVTGEYMHRWCASVCPRLTGPTCERLPVAHSCDCEICPILFPAGRAVSTVLYYIGPHGKCEDMNQRFKLDEVKEFRRSHGQLLWHFRTECPEWPLHEFHTDRPERTYPMSLICYKCLALHYADDPRLQTPLNPT